MFQLRDYQQRAIRDVVSIARANRNSACLVMPPGGGKTVTGSCAALEVARLRNGPVLWVAHRKELIKQAAKTLESLGHDVGIVAPWAKRTPSAPVQVGSVQTLRAIGSIPPSAVMVWDEAHHAMGDDWNVLTQQAREMKAFLLGLTATPERSDGRGLSPTLSNLVVAATQRMLISKGYLVPTDVFVPDRYITDGIADVPVTLWERYTPNTKTIVFCSSVEHAISVTEEFKARGYSAAYIDGSMSNRQRDSVLSRFISGSIDVLCNCQILTEGFDLPPVQTIILARSIGSMSLYLQMVGRGSRPFPGKKRNRCLDLVGNALLWGMPDDDRVFSLKGKPIRLKAEGESTGSSRFVRCPFCGALVTLVRDKKHNRPNSCGNCGKRVTRRQATAKIHGKRLEKMSSSERRNAEKVALDRLTDYAKSHGKNWDWITIKFVKKFGHAPKR